MRSAVRRLRAAAGGNPPVSMAPPGRGRGHGLRFPLNGGTASMDAYINTYKRSGTVFAIVSLLSEKAASVPWHLYRKAPVDGRVRYTTGDLGSDMRVEVVQHPALSLLKNPNAFFSRFEFFEGSNQHGELTGETFWVLDRENALALPTSMWYVTPSRMEPICDPHEFLLGWCYTAPDGTTVPLRREEVILEKRPDPADPYRGQGPVASIMPNIEQQRYATEYMRNMFINGAAPGGTIITDSTLTESEFEELIDRWRESHQGVARAGAIGVLENGNKWIPNPVNNRDLEYGNLRLANRDEMREAWRIHKHMLGTTDDVNRANAETADEVFNGEQIIPRLNRRRETLNDKLLPMFGDSKVEFDYENPLSPSREQQNAELTAKCKAFQMLIDSGVHPDDAAEVVGLPIMEMAEVVTQSPALPPNWVPELPTAPAPDQEQQDAQKLAALLRRELRPYTTRALPAAALNRRVGR